MRSLEAIARLLEENQATIRKQVNEVKGDVPLKYQPLINSIELRMSNMSSLTSDLREHIGG